MPALPVAEPLQSGRGTGEQPYVQDRVARLENWCRLRRGCFLGGLRRAVLPSYHSTLPAWRAGKQASERGASDRGRTLSERCLETCVMSVLGLYSKFAMQICNTTHFDNDQELRRLIAQGAPGRQVRVRVKG